MLRRQAMRQTKYKSANKGNSFAGRYWHTWIALRVLRCTTQFVTLLATPTAFVRAATCVLRPPSFITSFVSLTLHHVRSYIVASFHGFPPAITQKPTHGGKHIPFRKTNATIFTGFHYRFTTSCIHFSRVQSTRCQ